MFVSKSVNTVELALSSNLHLGSFFAGNGLVLDKNVMPSGVVANQLCSATSG
jgi:hypothetical protein